LGERGVLNVGIGIKLWGNVEGPRVSMVGGWHRSTFSGFEIQKIDVHRHSSTYSGLGKMN
jgi:hypothetical protein